MTELASKQRPKRPEFRNINALSDLPTYRLPPAGWVSILHRISGFIMFLLMPFIIWMFDTSISSEISFEKFKAAFNIGMLGLPGFLWKLVALALIWAYLHHFIAGMRHLWMDVSHAAVSKEFGKSSAIFTLAASIILTLVLGAKLFGLVGHFTHRGFARIVQNLFIGAGAAADDITDGSKEVAEQVGAEDGLSRNKPLVFQDAFAFDVMGGGDQHGALLFEDVI
jgi:succinate dehydrogenase / fumarate reductase cytochrome b subunit